jgi:hypothetical protein
LRLVGRGYSLGRDAIGRAHAVRLSLFAPLKYRDALPEMK